MNRRIFALCLGLIFLGQVVATSRADTARIVERAGKVSVTKPGAKATPAVAGQILAARDKIGTGAASRATLQMSEKWFFRVDEDTDVEITPGALGAKSREALKVALGGAFVFNREEDGDLTVQTPSATGGLRGTQLMVRVFPGGRTQMQVIEGEVEMRNDLGQILLRAGEAGESEIGAAPRKTAVISAKNLLQWALYYPAVVQFEDLTLTAEDSRHFSISMAAYRDGDLLGALDNLPPPQSAPSDAATVFRAAVMLAAGRVEASRSAMQGVTAENPGRIALERMLAAVLNLDQPTTITATTASEAMAESYYQQSRKQLGAARVAARRATELAPRSGFAWVRLAELEFSFGRTREALIALQRGLPLAPRNAQAHALRGFILSDQNQIKAAQAAFQEALRLDGGLGNGWLGLGLTKIKQGRMAEGTADLQTAATVEPLSSMFYSYHGKALADAGAGKLARKDLAMARLLDPHDPTPLLYGAILELQENRFNRSIRDLIESLEMNDNRQLYRSQFLLDQDRAVRGSNLAQIYQRNSMEDLAVREATRAVDSDYGSASAHLFLANSFDALRDPKRISLRYETAWFTEHLLADLLAPVGAGPLSQYVSQQEYSKLLETDGLGGSVRTEWRDGGHLDQFTSLFGAFGRVGFGMDFSYHRDRGFRPNNDSLRREANLKFKFQASPANVFFASANWQQEKGGDLFSTYNNGPTDPQYRFKEDESPGSLLVGWAQHWSPDAVTLLLGGRLTAVQYQSSPAIPVPEFYRRPQFFLPDFLRSGPNGLLEYSAATLRNSATPPVTTNPDGSLKFSSDFQAALAPFLGRGPVDAVFVGFPFADLFSSVVRQEIEINTAELQHLVRTERATLLVGGRWQRGTFATTSQLDLVNHANAPFFMSPAAAQNVSVAFDRRGLYAYDFFTPLSGLTLIAGAAWDRVERPENFRNLPISDRRATSERINGKIGFTWNASRRVTVRGVAAEALGGATFDQSVRLEPAQLAGFNETFRTIIPESIAGSVEAPVFRNYGLSLEGAWPTQTWWAASFQEVRETVTRTIGEFDIVNTGVLAGSAQTFPFPSGAAILPASTSEGLAYREQVFTIGMNQLVGAECALGARYRQTQSKLQETFLQVPLAAWSLADRRSSATLNELKFSADWNSPRGWFARADVNGYWQTWLQNTTEKQPAEDFWQLNIQAGHRFQSNRREIGIGVLNVTNRDYHLSPLSYLLEPPHRRTVLVNCRINF
jgi:tetratricopeptide (TPR) repeat protein